LLWVGVDEKHSCVVHFLNSLDNPLLDGEAPKEIYCPHSQKFEVDSFFSVIQADWKEPSFSDNVQVVNQTANVKILMKSK
jgi:hypothetical protein